MAIKEEIYILTHKTGGIINKNKNLMEHVSKSTITDKLINAARYGTPMVELGSNSPKVILTAGVHGNELPPQIASLWLIEDLIDKKLNGTVYVIPFAIPHATMKNSRRFKGFDMNRSASKNGSATNKILNATDKYGITSLADFHATKPRSNPGIESVFCSKKPCTESLKIAEHITAATSSKVICHRIAGAMYSGALEDECNLKLTAAVTCEVVSENNTVRYGSVERSYLQMESYLKYFNIL
jgi:predicted deacylase